MLEGYIVTWVFPAGGLFLCQKGTETGERACIQSVARLQLVKSYRTSTSAPIPPVYSLRRNHAYDKFAKYCNPKVGHI